MTDLLTTISSLPPERRALLRALLEQRALELKAPKPIEKRAGEGSWPLSFAQRRIWFLEQLEPESRAYTISFALLMKGPLDRPALDGALQEVVQRHETLRTRFPAIDGEPVAVLGAEPASRIPLIDLSGRSEAEREAEVGRLMLEEARRRFDLERGPLLFAHLLRLASDEHLLIFSIHHLVADAWSIGILFRELAQAYSSAGSGQRPSLPDLKISFGDYAAWQSSDGSTGPIAEELAHWRNKLQGLLPLELPMDRPRPLVQSYAAGREVLWLPSDLVERLRALGRAENATLFMTLLAAFQALLFRYSGQEDFAIGTATLGRNRSELEGLIGLFVNTLVLRSDLSGRPSFKELLARARRVSLEAFSHQELPFERLVQELHSDRHLARNPLFQVFFNMRSVSLPVGTFTGLSVELVPAPEAAAAFDLSLLVDETARGLKCTWEYSRALFDPKTVVRMAGHFEALLSAAIESPGAQVSTLPILTVRDRSLSSERPAAALPRRARSVREAFEVQAAAAPDRIAIESEHGGLTYGELEARANRLARHLLDFGAKRGGVIGVCLERTPDLVAALLAIWKTGAAYLPLDPSNPDRRLALMLSDGSVSLVLSEEALAARFSALSGGGDGRAVISIDRPEDAGAIAARSSAAPKVESSPRDLAYVIFTSGSTGRPKGVEVEHGSVANLIASMKEKLAFGEDDALLSVTTIGFDIAGLELWLPLVSGARMVLATREVASDGALLAEQIARAGATWMQATPATWRMLISSGWSGSPGLGILCGGEALSADLAGLLVTRGREVFNLYGPTETTIWSSIEPVTEESLSDWPWPVVPIGRPVASTTMCIVGADGELAPLGAPGELWIGGQGLARGYRARPDLTEERFVLAPFARGGRLYRTGDRARLRADGRFEYLGRIDEQLKVRGFRIEPREIESMLAEHETVKDCAVVANGEGEARRLVAYCVPRYPGSLSLDPVALRAFLKDRLPEYAVPSLFIEREALLFTANGKLDRRALAALEIGHLEPEPGRARAEPRDAIEAKLVEIWKEVLARDEVGIDDDFFALGGHSLLAVKLAGRIDQALGRRLTLMEIFRSPTIADLSRGLRDDGSTRLPASGEASQEAGPSPGRRYGGVQDVRREPISSVAREGELPLSFAQLRLWFIDALEGENGAYNIPVGFRLKGTLDERALTDSLTEIVRRHEVLRTQYVAGAEGRPVQVIRPAAAFPLQKRDLGALDAGAKADAVQRAFNQECSKRFDLARDLPIRAMLLVLGAKEHVLLVTLHHIAADGASMVLFDHELSELYAAFSKGLTSPLPPLPIQYVDYASWQGRTLLSEPLKAELAYWKKALLDAPRILQLPTDRPRPPVQRFLGAIEHFALDPQLTRRLKALGRESGATLFMTLLGAFAALLARLTGEEDLVIGSPIASRTPIETEPLIGCFLNTLALRIRVASRESFRGLLSTVRRTALDAYAHQDVPFEQVIEALQPKRDLSHSPLFQVMFILQNQPEAELGLTGLEVERLAREGTTAKYDLTLALTERDGALEGGFEYNTDLFDPITIKSLVRQVETLLEGILADPDRPISSLPLIRDDERHRLLVEWNDTAADYPEDATLATLFEASAKENADRIALVFGERRLTFRELNAEANRLAHHLRSLGVGPEVLVGLSLDRSIAMIVGLLGILKAGGVYLPLAPTLPKERLQFMIEDSGVDILVTEARLLGVLPSEKVRVVRLDDDAAELAKLPGDDPPPLAGPKNAAYAIYTSGSTGRPKGVVGLHRGAVNRLHWMARAYPFGEYEVCCQKTALSFVDSVSEILGPLLLGAPLVIVPDPALRDPVLLVRELAERRVTRLVLVPSLLRAIFDNVPDVGARLRSLRLCVTSGEALPVDLAERFRYAFPEATLLNLYGSSEDSGDVTCFDVPRSASASTSIPIGRPIANTELFVLDPQLEPVPIGFPGELYVGGASLARGYLHREALTDERFVPHRFDAHKARLFKTGDRVRYLADGNLEYLGRVDHQVKVRGFRIELGELEAVLGEHPRVRQVAVILQGKESGEPRLVAFYSVEQADGVGAADPGAAALRELAKQKLPDYMVPAAFVRLDAIPLTPSGKIDRQALSLFAIETSKEAGYVGPRDPVESKLVEIWEQILGRAQIGIHDDFFDLGGHSLLAVKMAGRIQAVLGRRIPLMEIFRAPTIAALAALIRNEAPVGPWHALEPLQLAGTRPPLFFVGSTVYARALVPALGPDQPFYAFNIFGLEHSVKEGEPLDFVEVARAYVDEMRAVQPHGPYRIAAYCGDSAIAYEMAILLHREDEEIALLAVIDTSTRAPRRFISEVKGTLDTLRAFGARYVLHRLERRFTHIRDQAMLRFSRLMIEEMPRFGIKPPLWFQHQRVVRALDRAVLEYVPKPYPGLLTRIQSREWLLRELARQPGPSAAKEVRILEVPGYHDRLFEEPGLSALGAVLRTCLDELL